MTLKRVKILEVDSPYFGECGVMVDHLGNKRTVQLDSGEVVRVDAAFLIYEEDGTDV